MQSVQNPTTQPATPEHWQAVYREAITDPEELLEALDLPSGLLPAARKAAALFPLRVPRGFVARMEPGNPDDPLLRQVLPLAEEQRSVPGYHADPVGDLAAMPIPGVLHKYHGRVLLVMTGACAINCRYCFRRHFPYAEAQLSQRQWQQALDYLRQATDVSEVILSGGDPLLLPDAKLVDRLRDLDQIPHLSRLRIHSRLPVVLPDRMTRTLREMLAGSRLQAVLVLHANHARELDGRVTEGIRGLSGSNTTLLNQAVLLRGVNDSAEAQIALSERLFQIGVLPYYLHLLDPVSGAAHFDVELDTARELLHTVRARLPGYLVPTLVSEQAGMASKTPHVNNDGVSLY
ncbi:EF-P beta-lysylation protein EpmB [Methylonatrum kenyense]|uniref:EF-P beta-lysylation protein EpmB n=1 Tax=Methylonatrum kenyense TaxID=455253 RepID=UPI0020BDFB1D|nr:EF-P beta-lysylation protein EpmB [Methylonatrum kenyense]MCK8515139.1 EF-P beta-lysylation protein EpmB [Methylonatrum kenyense]